MGGNLLPLTIWPTVFRFESRQPRYLASERPGDPIRLPQGHSMGAKKTLILLKSQGKFQAIGGDNPPSTRPDALVPVYMKITITLDSSLETDTERTFRSNGRFREGWPSSGYRLRVLPWTS